MKTCHVCGTPWESPKRQPGVKETCPTCSAYLHCCLNCKHHLPGAHNECYIPNTEFIADRRAANFCDEFEFADAEMKRTDETKKEAAKAALDTLFGAPEEKPKNLLDDFFRKL